MSHYFKMSNTNVLWQLNKTHAFFSLLDPTKDQTWKFLMVGEKTCMEANDIKKIMDLWV